MRKPALAALVAVFVVGDPAFPQTEAEHRAS
jgi:hypothetical protein